MVMHASFSYLKDMMMVGLKILEVYLKDCSKKICSYLETNHSVVIAATLESFLRQDS